MNSRSHFWLMLGLLIIAVFCLSEQPEPVRQHTHGYRLVHVKTCGGVVYAMIFSDAKLRIPMANPFVTNIDESYAFYTQNKCVFVEVK